MVLLPEPGRHLPIVQRFDQGPSLLLLPDLFRETFADLDTSLEAEGVTLLKCEPNYKVHFDDGECFELSTDMTRMKREVEKWEGKDGFERYLGFLREGHRHYERSVTHVLKRNFPSIFSILRPSFLRASLGLHPFESMYSRASRYFRTDRLRRVFTFASMYMGMSPFKAAGTYSLLQYSELAEGIWYPKGGFHSIISALVRIGERKGVDYRLSTAVASVNLATLGSSHHRYATGVTLATGEIFSADVVVINADLVYAYNDLLPPSSLAQDLSKRSASCSSISFYWAMNGRIPQLTTHNIFLAGQYQASLDDVFEKQRVPTEPSFYVNVPSRIDSTAAPDGNDTLVVLVPVGHLPNPSQGSRGLDVLNGQDWDELVSSTREKILLTISARTGCSIHDLANNILHESINTPQTWKSTFNLDKGAILGLSHHFLNVLSFRPRTKHPVFRALFFVGASTHPGTGVPVCLAGSRITSEQVLKSCGMDIPWNKRAQSLEPKKWKTIEDVSDIDQPHVFQFLSSLHIGLLILLSISAFWVSLYSSNSGKL